MPAGVPRRGWEGGKPPKKDRRKEKEKKGRTRGEARGGEEKRDRTAWDQHDTCPK